MTTSRDAGIAPPFPVAPSDVPPEAVTAVKRTLLRNPHPGVDPLDDDLARLVVAVVIAALREGPVA